MNQIIQIINNPYIQVGLLSWFIAQLIKVLSVLVQDKKIDFTKFISSGGMPSSHSSLVSSITVAIGEVEGYDSILFALSTIFALIVMYDAAGVRRAAGKQARILNLMIDEMDSSEFKMEKRLKELLGHTPAQVFAGALLGIFIASIKF